LGFSSCIFESAPAKPGRISLFWLIRETLHLYPYFISIHIFFFKYVLLYLVFVYLFWNSIWTTDILHLLIYVFHVAQMPGSFTRVYAECNSVLHSRRPGVLHSAGGPCITLEAK
jgi:hypothetical protein